MKTQYGQLSNLKVRWDEIKESVGNFLLKAVIPLADATTTLITEQKSATEQFKDQNSKVLDLTTTTTGLLNRYDELKGKTNLSTKEQVELKKVINEIATAIPGAITQYDNLGKAMDINSGKARQYIENQVLLLKYLNQDAITETQGNIKKIEGVKVFYDDLLSRQLEAQQNQLAAKKLFVGEDEQIAKRRLQNELGLQKTITETTQKQIEQGNLLAGANKHLADLKGDTLKQELKDREDAAAKELKLQKTAQTTTQADADKAAKEKQKAEGKELKSMQDIYNLKVKMQQDFDANMLTNDTYYNKRIDMVNANWESEKAIIAKELEFHKINAEEAALKYVDAEKKKNDSIKAMNVAKMNVIISDLQYEVELSKSKLDEQLAAKKRTDAEMHLSELMRIQNDTDAKVKEWKEKLNLDKSNQAEVDRQIALVVQKARTATAQEDAAFEEKERALKVSNQQVNLANELAAAKDNIDKEYAIKLQQLEDQKAEEIRIAKEKHQDLAAIDAKYAKIEADLYKELQLKKIADAKETAEKVLAGLTALNELMNQLGAKELQDATTKNNAKKTDLDKQLKAGLISQQEHDYQVALSAYELDKKADKLARDAAIRNKELQIIQTIINTAAGIASQLVLGPAGIPMAIVAGVMGALQLATIIATPLPAATAGTIPQLSDFASMASGSTSTTSGGESGGKGYDQTLREAQGAANVAQKNYEDLQAKADKALQDAKDVAAKNIEDAKNAADKQVQDAWDKSDKAIAEASSRADQISQDAEKALATALSEFEKANAAVQSAQDKIQQVANDRAATADAAAQKAIADAWINSDKAIEEASKKADQIVSDALKTLADALSQLDKANQDVLDAQAKITQTANDRAAKAIQDAWTNSDKAIEDASKKADQIASDALKTLSDAMSALSKAQSDVQAAQDKIDKKAADKQDAADKAATAALDAADKLAQQQADDATKAVDTATKSVEAAQKAYDDAVKNASSTHLLGYGEKLSQSDAADKQKAIDQAAQALSTAKLAQILATEAAYSATDAAAQAAKAAEERAKQAADAAQAASDAEDIANQKALEDAKAAEIAAKAVADAAKLASDQATADAKTAADAYLSAQNAAADRAELSATLAEAAVDAANKLALDNALAAQKLAQENVLNAQIASDKATADAKIASDIYLAAQLAAAARAELSSQLATEAVKKAQELEDISNQKALADALAQQELAKQNVINAQAVADQAKADALIAAKLKADAELAAEVRKQALDEAQAEKVRLAAEAAQAKADETARAAQQAADDAYKAASLAAAAAAQAAQAAAVASGSLITPITVTPTGIIPITPLAFSTDGGYQNRKLQDGTLTKQDKQDIADAVATAVRSTQDQDVLTKKDIEDAMTVAVAKVKVYATIEDIRKEDKNYATIEARGDI